MGGLILAVDGGNSKTDVALVAGDGRLLSAFRGPTISHQQVGLENGLKQLRGLVENATAAAGISDIPVMGIYGLAGADLPADFRNLEAGLAATGLSRETLVVNDANAALRAGTRRGWGIALVCGAGVNGYGRSPNGRTARFDGLGDVTGDWGGGGAVGLAALGAAVRARDGRSIRTTLEQLVPAHFGLGRPASVANAFFTGHLSEERLDEIAPIVFEAAAAGDAAARAIVDRQTEELAVMASALARRLGLTRTDIDIVLTGGVFRGYNQVFLSDLTRRIRQHVPKAEVFKVQAPPVAGSALIGLDLLAGGQVSSGAEERLKKALIRWAE